MDVTDPRFGSRMRDRDERACQIQLIFKRFLKEYSGEDEPMDAQDEDMRDDITTASKDSFASARSKTAGVPGGVDGDRERPSQSKYSKDALKLLENDYNTLFVDFKDVQMFDADLADSIIHDYYRFYNYLCRALAAFAREEKIRQSEAEIDPDADVVERTRIRELVKSDLDRPQVVNKDYYVGFYNFSNRDNIRDLSVQRIGVLTRVVGQVVRTHQVHPELIIGCFKCQDCLSEQYQEQQFRYTQPGKCSNDNCNNRTRWTLVLEKSRFTDFQRLRIQETQAELPRGCIPRSFDVVLRGTDQMECIQPGDQVDFVGTLIAVPDVGQMMSGIIGTTRKDMSQESGISGLKNLGVKEMTYTLAFLANSCMIDGQSRPCSNVDKERETTYTTSLDIADFTREQIATIEKMRDDPKLLENLSQSLFTSIYGSDDIKKGIFLQLLGGVPKRTSTGTKLRGDINLCLVGDPSTAKSQFLKIVTDFAPIKAVYASGKASSASGLTAAVVRDTDGGFVIEAGALMLADKGICCIDEFDKMDLKDQVALHEAMEQQTISITKAGVSATLNARASILAAANPIGSTYDTKRDLRSNVNFSLPIMSRFDLFFVLVDPHDRENDQFIASRVLDMHLNYANTQSWKQEMRYSFEDIRLYVQFARRYFPKIPIETEGTFIREYNRLRSNSTTNKTAWRITVRQLESLVRLSEAITRGHCADVVKPEYIKEAAKLIEKTLIAVGSNDILLDEQDEPTNFTSANQPESQGMYDGEMESQRLEPTQSTKTGIKIPVAEYMSMAEVLVRKLRTVADDPDSEEVSMRKMDLVNWYLHQCSSEIATESDLIKRKQLCEQVIARLVRVDHVLAELKEDMKVVDPSQPDEQADANRHLIVYPSFDPEDFFQQTL